MEVQTMMMIYQASNFLKSWLFAMNKYIGFFANCTIRHNINSKKVGLKNRRLRQDLLAYLFILFPGSEYACQKRETQCRMHTKTVRKLVICNH